MSQKLHGARPASSIGRRFAAISLAAAIVAVCSTRLSADKPTSIPGSPLTADESLQHFAIHPQARIELVAAEPEVIDPVAIAFDAELRLWVVEMSDYPHGPKPGEPPKSRVRILEDRDQDGRYETSTLFADGLLFANGIQPWRGGVIVTMSGAVAWMKDTDGDNAADVKETWFTGFVEQNPQLRANHPTFAMDNHVYVANGLRGGEVQAVRPEWTENAPRVSISGRDFRFDPLNGSYEAVTGVGQFGLTFDDFGNRFVCSNRNPCIHVVLANRYLARNPNVAITTATHDVSPAGADSQVFPLSEAWTTSTLHAGQFTAACGVTICRGTALRDFYGNSFTCEPTGNLVHRDVLAPSGATFSSQPGRRGKEFLASPDTWFRPVNMTIGPDGALYVVDMYRAVIEHPQFMPEELKERPDLHEGSDRGRIYRIVSTQGETKPAAVSPPLAELTGEELVRQLEQENSWQCDTAARLVYERQDHSATDDLVAIVKSSSMPDAKVRALWLLQGLDELSPAVLATALDDEQARVREHAVRLAEPWLDSEDELRRRVIAQVEEADDPRLLFQVALSLGEIQEDPAAQSALSRLALHQADDVWIRRAVLTSLGEEPVEFLVDTLRFARQIGSPTKPGVAELIGTLGEVAGAQGDVGAALSELVEVTPQQPALEQSLVWSGLVGLGTGLDRRGKSLQDAVDELPSTEQEWLSSLFQKAAQVAGDASATTAQRRQALELLPHASYKVAGPVLRKLARDEPQQATRLVAIEALSRFDAPDIAGLLLEDFQAQTPAVRRSLIDALLGDQTRTERLLDELESGGLSVVELSPTHQTRLKRLRDVPQRARAEKILASAVPADRREVLAQYAAALELPPDPLRGRGIFKRECITCHKIGTLGVDVGPDIADSRTQTPAKLLTAILDPNRAVDANYFSFTVVTAQGRVLNGMIASENAASISLRQPENKTIAVLRDEIEEMKSDGVSLMPVGFEKKITVQEMADLISFIKNWRYLDDEDVLKSALGGDAN